MALAERARLAIAERKIKHEGSATAKHVTASFGVATLVPGGKARPDSLIKCADQGLYHAKECGRNQVAFFECKCWE